MRAHRDRSVINLHRAETSFHLKLTEIMNQPHEGERKSRALEKTPAEELNKMLHTEAWKPEP